MIFIELTYSYGNDLYEVVDEDEKRKMPFKMDTSRSIHVDADEKLNEQIVHAGQNR